MWFEIQYQRCCNRSRWWVCVRILHSPNHRPYLCHSRRQARACDVIALRTTDSFLKVTFDMFKQQTCKAKRRTSVNSDRSWCCVTCQCTAVYAGVQPGHVVSRHSQPPARRQHGRPVYTLSPSLYACVSLFFVGICTRITYRWLKRTRSRGFTIWSNCKLMVWGAFKSGAIVSQRLAVCTCVYSGRVRSLLFLS